MKLNYKWFTSTIMAILFLLTACQKEEVETYDLNESKVYFQVQNFSSANGRVGYTTQISYSFVGAKETVTNAIFRGIIQLLGKVENYDRKVKIVIDRENTTMTEGEDYEINLDTIVIKANENQVNLEVRFLRNASFMTQKEKLVLKLEPNEYFTVLEKYKSVNTWSNTTAEYLDGSRYTFIIDEIYSEPGSWATLKAENYFGTWTAVKYTFINNFFGFSLDDWYLINAAGSKITAGRMPYYATQLQKELQRRADESSPVLDENGSYMQLPEPYQVDYSNVQ